MHYIYTHYLLPAQVRTKMIKAMEIVPRFLGSQGEWIRGMLPIDQSWQSWEGQRSSQAFTAHR